MAEATNGNGGAVLVERTVTLSDAVVSIAMTLLVLPLVDLVGDLDPNDVWPGVREHRDVFLGFLLSFLVIHGFWRAHHGVFVLAQRLPGPPRVLGGLNMLWLLVIAFLPFPTALIGKHATTSTTPLYIGTMFALSALTSAMYQSVQRTAPDDARAPASVPARLARRLMLAWWATAVFGVCALISTRSPDGGLYGLLVIVVVRFVASRGARVTGRPPA